MRIGFGIASLALVLVSACSEGRAAEPKEDPKVFDASGTIKLLATSSDPLGGTCSGSGGYDDISEGAQVVVTDAESKRVAIGRLNRGEPGQYQTCSFPFVVKDVPSGKGPYGIEVSNRGEVAFDEVTAGMLSLSLG